MESGAAFEHLTQLPWNLAPFSDTILFLTKLELATLAAETIVYQFLANVSDLLKEATRYCQGLISNNPSSWVI